MSHHASSAAMRARLVQMARRAEASAPGSTTFFLPDSSPMVRYGQAGSSGSGWSAGYAAQSDGYDETLHYTAGSNTTLAANITANSISLLIPAFPSCTATLSINGSSPTPACATASNGGDIPFTISNLPAGTHSLQWSTGTVPSGSQVVFWGIQASRPSEHSDRSNVTIDDSYATRSVAGQTVQMAFSGTWQHDTSGQGAASGSLNKTVSSTSSQGAQVSFSSKGSAIYLYGPVGPDFGSASVLLNGQVVAPAVNLTSPWPLDYSLLWLQTGLDPSATSNVTLTNLQNSKKMGIDFVILTADSGLVAGLNIAAGTVPSVGTLTGKLVLGIVIPLAALLLLGLGIWLFLRKRRRARAARAARVDHRGSGAAILRTDGLTSPSDYSEKGPYSEYASAVSGRTVASLPYSSSGSGGGARSAITAASTSAGASSPERHEADLGEDSEVFVSYDAAKGQRMSDRWNMSQRSSVGSPSPITPTSDGSSDDLVGQQRYLTPQPSMTSMSQPRSVAGTSPAASVPRRLPGIAESSAHGDGNGSAEQVEATNNNSTGVSEASYFRIWSAIQSLLGAPPSAIGSALMTALPAYSPEDTNNNNATTWHSDPVASPLPYDEQGRPLYGSDTTRTVSPASNYAPRARHDASRGASPEHGVSSTANAAVMGFPSSFDEKAQLMLSQGGSEKANPSAAGQSGAPMLRATAGRQYDERASTVAPSSIVSIFGAPPSIRDRDSMFTVQTPTAAAGDLSILHPPPMPLPAIDTSVRHGTGMPISAVHSPVLSALSRSTDRSGASDSHLFRDGTARGLDGEVQQGRSSSPPRDRRSSGVSVRSVSSVGSAHSGASARPDSAIMPV